MVWSMVPVHFPSKLFSHVCIFYFVVSLADLKKGVVILHEQWEEAEQRSAKAREELERLAVEVRIHQLVTLSAIDQHDFSILGYLHACFASTVNLHSFPGDEMVLQPGELLGMFLLLDFAFLGVCMWFSMLV